MDTPIATLDIAADARTLPHGSPSTACELLETNDYWRATNYVSVGQMYLYDNPLLRKTLTLAHVKPLVVGLDRQIKCRQYAYAEGIDQPDIVAWRWPLQAES